MYFTWLTLSFRSSFIHDNIRCDRYQINLIWPFLCTLLFWNILARDFEYKCFLILGNKTKWLCKKVQISQKFHIEIFSNFGVLNIYYNLEVVKQNNVLKLFNITDATHQNLDLTILLCFYFISFCVIKLYADVNVARNCNFYEKTTRWGFTELFRIVLFN